MFSRWAFPVFLLSALIFIQYRLWFDSGGIRDSLVLKKNLAAQLEENKKTSERNAVLLGEIKQLQANQEATEEKARNELGMIRKGETFYQIVKKEKE